MKANSILAITLSILAASVCVAEAAESNVDDIRRLEAAQAAAWNAHDATAYAHLFTADADTVNVLGWWWKSRAELEQKLGAGFSFVFAKSTLHLEEVSVRFLSKDVAIVHVRWSMTGAVSPDGSGGNIPNHGIQTQAVQKTSDGWRIAAFHNVNQVPERSFPTDPSGTSR
jgi:uncharacterized protein (TIGR02246 family)